MKDINLNLENQTERIKRYLGNNKSVASGPGINIRKFSDLVKEMAELSYLNKDCMLFYRGQTDDYPNSTNSSSSLYPSIYRDRINKKDNDFTIKIRKLNKCSDLLVEETKKTTVIGKEEITKKKYIQWSILQHYGICETPLLDVTHSLRVACSFAFEKNNKEWGFLYVLGLPYVTNRISTNSEQDTVVVRLLSICPPQALRPYYQDGYLVGTEFITEDVVNKGELDLVRRLIGKYKIWNNDDFWDQDTTKLPYGLLFPADDFVFMDISKKIQNRLALINYDQNEFAEEYGKFLLQWNEVEKIALGKRVRETYLDLFKKKVIDSSLYVKIRKFQSFRNNLVHKPNLFSLNDIRQYNFDIQDVVNEIKKKL